MSVPATGSKERKNELGIFHQRDYWSWAACLLDLRVAQAGEVLSRMAGFIHSQRRWIPGQARNDRLNKACFGWIPARVHPVLDAEPK